MSNGLKIKPGLGGDIIARKFRISTGEIGEGCRCYVIAEMSANHAGDLDRALEIVHAAKEAGADCIKTQTYTPDTMTIDCDNDHFAINKGTWKGENLYSLYQKAYTPWEWLGRIKEETEKAGLDFLSTPFDQTAVDFLETLDVSFYKIASFELVDIPLVKYTAAKGKPMIISTGMGSLGEIEEAVKAVRTQGNNDICLLKCSSAYPAIPADMNLATLEVLKKLFDCAVGFSDHSMGSVAAIAAVAMGAKVIEKHFCLSRQIENPDASFSMEPHEFKRMVEDIREAEKAMGKIDFSVSEKESESRIFRKSIFVVRDVLKGESFTPDNIRVIRPGYGLLPKHYEEIIGKKASRDLTRGMPLEWIHVE